MFYAGLLVENISIFNKYGILDEVIDEKLVGLKYSASGLLKQLEVNSFFDLFNSLSVIFGFSEWTIEAKGQQNIVITKQCLLCTMAKKRGNISPCLIHCIPVLSTLIIQIDASKKLEAQKNLWEHDCCKLIIK